MAIIDVTYTKVNPEQPSSQPGQQVNLYAPYASAEVAGLIKYDDSIFVLNNSRQLTLSEEWLDVTFTAKSPNNLENVNNGSVQTKNADNNYSRDYGIAIGKGLKSASSTYLYGLIGRYNEDTNERGDAYFVVGDGVSDTERHNIFEVTSNGVYHNHNKLVPIINDTIFVNNIKTRDITAETIDVTDAIAVQGAIQGKSLTITGHSVLDTLAVTDVLDTSILTADELTSTALFAVNANISNNLEVLKDTTIGGGLTVRGPLTLQGQGTTVDFDTVESKNNIIVTNSNASPIGGLYTGIVSLHGQDEGNGNAIAVALYNPTADAVQIGFGAYNADNTFESDELRTVAIRTDSKYWNPNEIAIWDSSINGFKSSGKKTDDFLTGEDAFQEFVKTTKEQGITTTQKIDLSGGQLSLSQESTGQGISAYSFVAKQNKIELVSQGVSLFKYASGEYEPTIDMSSTSGAGKIRIDTERVKLTQYGRNKILKFPSNTELSGDVTYTLPNKSGTIALTDDIPEGGGGGIVTSVNGSSTETGIYAPTTYGSAGARLVAQGENNAPVWDSGITTIIQNNDSNYTKHITLNEPLYIGKIIRVFFSQPSITTFSAGYQVQLEINGDIYQVRTNGQSGYYIWPGYSIVCFIITKIYAAGTIGVADVLSVYPYHSKDISYNVLNTNGYRLVLSSTGIDTEAPTDYLICSGSQTYAYHRCDNPSNLTLAYSGITVSGTKISVKMRDIYIGNNNFKMYLNNESSAKEVRWADTDLPINAANNNSWEAGEILTMVYNGTYFYIIARSGDMTKVKNALTTTAQTLTAAQQQQVLTNLGLVNVAVNGQ